MESAPVWHLAPSLFVMNDIDDPAFQLAVEFGAFFAEREVNQHKASALDIYCVAEIFVHLDQNGLLVREGAGIQVVALRFRHLDNDLMRSHFIGSCGG